MIYFMRLPNGVISIYTAFTPRLRHVLTGLSFRGVFIIYEAAAKAHARTLLLEKEEAIDISWGRRGEVMLLDIYDEPI